MAILELETRLRLDFGEVKEVMQLVSKYNNQNT